MLDEKLIKAAKAIQQADTIFISAGAGMGVDSGLPDFRGDQGFWKAYPQLKEQGVGFQEQANPDWFVKDPERAWGFYGHRYQLYQSTEPHKGFQILRRLANQKSVRPFVFTSNIDGHFQKSGFAPNDITECHGSIYHLQCINNCKNKIWADKSINFTIDQNLRAVGKLPSCPFCKGIARPNILMLDDWKWNPVRTNRQELRQREWKKAVRKQKIVVIELGAGVAIPSARLASASMKTTIIRINPRVKSKQNNVILLNYGALEALLALEEIIQH